MLWCTDTGVWCVQIEARGDDYSRFHNYICGVIPVAQQLLFERMLFRTSRGNAYARFQELEEDLDDVQTGEPVHKAVFYVVYLGNTLQRRIEKMCDFFRASRHEVPENPQVRPWHAPASPNSALDLP